MEKKLPAFQHLTENPSEAMESWQRTLSRIKEANRTDVLNSPVVLDVGGGMGEFSKYLNSHGIQCVTLDRKDLSINPIANPVMGSAYKMPFRDQTFNIVHCRGVFDTGIYGHDFQIFVPEIARVLKPKGLLSIEEYAYRALPKQELKKEFKCLKNSVYQTLWEKK